jgi:enoyl-CoA hydratase/carnithine racemase
MPYQYIIYTREDGVAWLRINRPEVLNAISPALLSEMKDALEKAGKDDEIGVVVLTGEGRAFSAGVDLKSLGDRKLEGGRVGPILDDPAREMLDIIQTMPKVVIAMVNGYCFTGALEIVLACDLIIAAEEAKLGDTHTRWGIRPSWGMSQRLPLMVGMPKAKELSFTADTITAREAERIGLVNMVVPGDKLEAAVKEMAQKILGNSREAIAACKYLYNRSQGDQLRAGLELEARSEFTIGDTENRLGQFRKKD